MNIFEKMSAITEEITAVAKNLNVGWGQNSYKAVGEADVLAAVKPIEVKHGVYSYPVSRQVIDSSVIESVDAKGKEKKQIFMRIETVYRFVNVEKPGEYIDITTYGDGVDAQDKAPGKAMTYADKYALLKAYKIITGDDPDQNYSSELKNKETKAAKTTKPKTTQDNPADVIKLAEQIALKSRCDEDGVDKEKLLNLYGLKSFEEMKYKHYDNIIKNWYGVKAKCGGGK